MTIQSETQNDGLRVIFDVVSQPSAAYSSASRVSTADAAVAIFRDLQTTFAVPTSREAFVVLALDGRHKPLGVQVVSVGTLTSSLVHPREVFRYAIAAGAAAIIVMHNHPAGDPKPSSQDVDVTKRLAAAGTVLGIPLLDHLVIAGAPSIDDGASQTGADVVTPATVTRHYSFREQTSILS